MAKKHSITCFKHYIHTVDGTVRKRNCQNFGMAQEDSHTRVFAIENPASIVMGTPCIMNLIGLYKARQRQNISVHLLQKETYFGKLNHI